MLPPSTPVRPSLIVAALAVLSIAAAGCATPLGAPPPPLPPTSAEAGGQTIIAIAAPSPPQQTLLDFLGFTQITNGIGACEAQKHAILARLFPEQARALDQLLGGPPSPEELASDNPAVAAAAQLEADEAEAEATINALEKLAAAGCGRIPGVDEAILSALDSYNPRVRLAAVQAVIGTAGDKCVPCNGSSCCTPAIRKKLRELAFDTTPFGCPKESSAEVRRNARVALTSCGPEPPELAPVPDPALDLPLEGPSPDQLPPPVPVPGLLPAPDPLIAPPSPHPAGPLPPPPAPSALPAPNGQTLSNIPQSAPADSPSKSQATPQSVARGSVVSPRTNVQGNVEPETVVRTSYEETVPQPASQRPAAAGRVLVRWEEIHAPLANFDSADEAAALLERIREVTALPPDERRNVGLDVSRCELRTLGWIDPSTLPEGRLRQLLDTAKVGDVGPILATPNARTLVRLIGRRPADGDRSTSTGPTRMPAEPNVE